MKYYWLRFQERIPFKEKSLRGMMMKDEYEWYYETFVQDYCKYYGQMNPKGLKGKGGKDAKYSFPGGKGSKSLNYEKLLKSFNDTERYLSKERKKGKPTKWSFAIVPAVIDKHETKQDVVSSKFIVLDIDEGGRKTIQKALSYCKEHGLFAFAQLSESNKHSGGHLWIPIDKHFNANFLKLIAEKIKEDLELNSASTYPSNNLIRLPIQHHLRHPSGIPTRLPILTTNETEISTVIPEEAIKQLRSEWKENSIESIRKLTPIATEEEIDKSKKNIPHRSKVNQSNTTSVINYFNKKYSLLGQIKVKKTGVISCTHHEDENPSLLIWFHDSGKYVCKCLSQNSDCELMTDESNHYVDAFKYYCIKNGLTESEAVKRIVEEEEIAEGRKPSKREVYTDNRTLQKHKELLNEKRKKIHEVISKAATKKGTVSVLNVTPGAGKSYIAAQYINKVKEGIRAAVCCETNDMAKEWMYNLDNGFIWEPKSDSCKCYPELNKATELGCSLPECKPGCEYQKQKEDSKGRVVIYKHNHLYLKNGSYLLKGASEEEKIADIIIIDESPYSKLIEVNEVNQESLKNLLKVMKDDAKFPIDAPARQILEALIEVGRESRKCKQEVDVIDELKARFESNLSKLIDSAIKNKKYTSINPVIKYVKDIPKEKLFYGKMLIALQFDVERGQNCLISFSNNAPKDIEEANWKWHYGQKHIPLKDVSKNPDKPAVIILDGTGQEKVYDNLFTNWEIDMFDLDIPMSPKARIIQLGKVPNTRRITKEEDTLTSLVKKLSYELNEMGLICTGGITYKKCKEEIAKHFGGNWLHYRNQKGSNELKEKEVGVVIGIPTVPPSTIEREAKILFCDSKEPFDTKARKDKEEAGLYHYPDKKLQTIYEEKVFNEIYQAIHRFRPILAEKNQTIIIAASWPLEKMGIKINKHLNAFHGNSKELKNSIKEYSLRRERDGGSEIAYRGGGYGTLKEEEFRKKTVFTNCKSKNKATLYPLPFSSPLPPLSKVTIQLFLYAFIYNRGFVKKGFFAKKNMNNSIESSAYDLDETTHDSCIDCGSLALLDENSICEICNSYDKEYDIAS